MSDGVQISWMNSQQTVTPTFDNHPIMILKARLSNGTTVDLTLEQNISQITVGQLKNIIHQSYGEAADGMRLVVKGKILQDDESVLSDYNIREFDTIHVAKPRNLLISPSSSASANRTLRSATAESDPMDELMANPMVEAMMSNPTFMRSIMQSNPQVQRMIQEMPELAEAMNDPSFFQELTRSAKNPRLRQEMMRNQDRTLQNIESMPGGMQHLSSMFKTLNNASSHSDSGTEEADKKLASLLLGNNTSPSADKPNDLALPNPWAPRRPTRNVSQNLFPSRTSIPITQSAPASSTMMSPLPLLFSPQSASSANAPMNLNFMQQYSMMQQSIQPPITNNLTTIQAPPVNIEPVETRYREQLDTLKDMGFTNEEQNKRAILAAAGNLDGAVEYILGSSQNI